VGGGEASRVWKIWIFGFWIKFKNANFLSSKRKRKGEGCPKKAKVVTSININHAPVSTTAHNR
jgi:hypothetical protein